MSCAHSGGKGAVADCQWADAVHHGEADDVVAVSDLLGDLDKYLRRGGMAFVIESGDCATVIVIAHIAGKCDHSTCRG